MRDEASPTTASGEDPVGRRFQVAGTEEWLQVVGVVSDVRVARESEQGSKEIGLRLALGAEVGTVRWLVVSEGARLLASGRPRRDP